MGLGAISFQIGAAIMTFAPSVTVLMIGRLLAGVGIGFGAMVSGVYIAEISPAGARGTLTSLPEICINIGILLGYVSNYAFSGFSEHINWRIMLGVGILPSVFIGFALFMIPESPRWLMMEKRVLETRAVLLQISESEAEVEERLSEIEESAGLMKSMKSEEKEVWRELLNPSAVRRMLYAGCGIQLFQQITGIDATVYYSPTIFKDAGKPGIKSDQELLAATVAEGFTKTVFILVAIFLIDKSWTKATSLCQHHWHDCMLVSLGSGTYIAKACHGAYVSMCWDRSSNFCSLWECGILFNWHGTNMLGLCHQRYFL
jgi:MFS family permease